MSKDISSILIEAWGATKENPFKKEDRWKYQEDVYFYVIRRYSGVTRQKHLVQIESRRFDRYGDAVDFKNFLEGEKKNKKKKYQVIAIPEEEKSLV